MAKPGRRCTICTHAQRAEIDAAVGSAVRIAKRFGVSAAAFTRHRKHAAFADASRHAGGVALAQPSAAPTLTGDAPAVAVEGPTRSGAPGVPSTPPAPAPSTPPGGAASQPLEVDARVLAQGIAESLAAELVAARGNPDYSPRDRATLSTAATGALRLLARLSGQLEISHTQILRSAPWRDLMAALDEVLLAHPGAARDWVAALRELDGDG